MFMSCNIDTRIDSVSCKASIEDCVSIIQVVNEEIKLSSFSE